MVAKKKLAVLRYRVKGLIGSLSFLYIGSGSAEIPKLPRDLCAPTTVFLLLWDAPV